MMASTTRVRGNSTRNEPSERPTSPTNPSFNLPDDALAPYSTFWSVINHQVLTKIRADAMSATGGDSILVRDYMDEKTTEFDAWSDKVHVMMQSLSFFKYLTYDLQAATYDHFVWMVLCDVIFEEDVTFPGDTKVWKAFGEWLLREKGVDAEEELKWLLEIAKNVEDDSEDDRSFPQSGEGVEDRYADGEDEDTHGGVRLIWE